MKQFTPDRLSVILGRFEQDAYLVARGVRFLASHNFKKDDFKLIKKNILKIVSNENVDFETIEGDDINIILYHKVEGKAWIEKLKKLDKKLDKYEKSSRVEKLFEKIIDKKSLNMQEKKLLDKISKENEFLDEEYGKVFGYSDSSIRRSIE